MGFKQLRSLLTTAFIDNCNLNRGMGLSQIQSNALAALQALDDEVAEEVLAAGCVTGDRVNGLCDGLTGDW